MRLATGYQTAMLSFVMLSWCMAAGAASPSAQQALKLAPIQEDVDFDRPSGDRAARCKISARKIDDGVGWVVEDPDGLTLRRFVDSNGDNVVDLWCYYKNGLEVYRDIDADYDGKADQYRWFHTAGCRWGLDHDEDGQIDVWKVISAEEVATELIAALARRDTRRFARLVLTADEVKTLGLGKERTEKVAKNVAAAASQFNALADRQKLVTPDSRWVQFTAAHPGTVPAGTDGSTKDLQVYENTIAIVETGGRHDQVQIGTLVKVGDAWRLIGVPQSLAEGQTDLAASGFFFEASLGSENPAGGMGPKADSQELLGELEKLDQAADKATTAQQRAELNARRAEVLQKLAESSRSSKDRAMWLRQLADMVSAAVQSGAYPDGAQRLKALFDNLGRDESDKDLAAYVRFRQLTAEYGLALREPKPDFAKVQTQWLKNLEQYATEYPSSPDAAEAMLQLGIAKEFAGQEDEARQWYGRIVEAFADSPAAKKAAGARTRLDSVGKVIRFSGEGLSGRPVDLAKYRGRVVLIQYWATWCQPALREIPVLKKLLEQYAGKFNVIAVSLDNSRSELDAYLAENRLPWPQIFEPGGLDSRPANQLGILTLPTMILVDQQGKVVNRNIQMAELEDELKKLVR